MKQHFTSRFTVWLGLFALLTGAQAVHAEPLVYVPLGGDGKILVVDVAKDQVVETIEGLAAVHGLAATPDGRYLIAGSYEERAANGNPAKPQGISEDEHAAHHQLPAAGSEKPAVASVSTVSVIRTIDRTIVRAIDVPGAVHHVSVSPDGQYAAVTRPNENSISVIDLTTYEISTNIATGSFPNYSVFSPDSTRLYISNAGDNTVAVVDVKGWGIETAFAVGSSPEHVVLSKDGKTLYVNNVDDGTVSVVDTETGQVGKAILVGSTLHGIDLSEDGSKLFVASLGDDKIAQIDLASGAVETAELSPAPYHLATISGTGKIYVSSADEPKIWVVGQKELNVIGQIVIGGKGHQMVQVPGS